MFLSFPYNTAQQHIITFKCVNMLIFVYVDHLFNCDEYGRLFTHSQLTIAILFIFHFLGCTLRLTKSGILSVL